ncbi:MAG TPA: serine/threonine-protein kinase, partial [Blastocatellia bacterium]|nr:serine/threonine-protein kinase [Blastocatellia bacterium]
MFIALGVLLPHIMTPELYRKISEIYHAASVLEPEQRPDFLKQACNGDEVLLREVEQLLLSNEQAGSFLAKPAVEIEHVIEKVFESSSHHELLIGREFGQYQILSKIGAGGMGEVFLAEDNRLGRKVALKLLPAEFVSDSVRVKRFEREAKAAGATAHPNIVSIYDIGQSENIHYIASEFVEGETLRRRIRRSPLRPIEALDIAMQVAGALASAHNAGFIHRDIKPENIMVRPDGFVKVLDFGLAAFTKPEFYQANSDSDDAIAISIDTLPGTIIGTVNYMSPEQVRGQKVDDRTDLWSLGVVLFEMLTGHSPFPGQSVPDTFVSILDRPPLPLNDAPFELEEVIHKLLAKEREDRYQTAEELT